MRNAGHAWGIASVRRVQGLGPKLPSQAHLHDRCRRVRGLEVGPDSAGREARGNGRAEREGYFLVTGRPASFQAVQPPSKALAFFHPA